MRDPENSKNTAKHFCPRKVRTGLPKRNVLSWTPARPPLPPRDPIRGREQPEWTVGRSPAAEPCLARPTAWCHRRRPCVTGLGPKTVERWLADATTEVVSSGLPLGLNHWVDCLAMVRDSWLFELQMATLMKPVTFCIVWCICHSVRKTKESIERSSSIGFGFSVVHILEFFRAHTRALEHEHCHICVNSNPYVIQAGQPQAVPQPQHPNSHLRFFHIVVCIN